MINEQTTGGVQRPAQLINTAQRSGEGGAQARWTDVIQHWDICRSMSQYQCTVKGQVREWSNVGGKSSPASVGIDYNGLSVAPVMCTVNNEYKHYSYNSTAIKLLSEDKIAHRLPQKQDDMSQV